jgi:hypothetical protein
MKSPQKRAARPANAAPEPTHLLRFKYHSVALLARLFETPFWFFEQRRARLADELERRRW